MLEDVFNETALKKINVVGSIGGSLHRMPIAELVNQLESNEQDGLDSTTALVALEIVGPNEIVPPLQCPAWMCCLLPGLKKTPAMLRYNDCVADMANIIRSGRKLCIDPMSLVPGDIVMLEKGDIVPADCRVISCSEDLIMQLFDCPKTRRNCFSESSLSGESFFNASCVLLSGCLIVSGSARCVVVLTGKSCVMSQLSQNGHWPPKVQCVSQHLSNGNAKEEEFDKLLPV